MKTRGVAYICQLHTVFPPSLWTVWVSFGERMEGQQLWKNEQRIINISNCPKSCWMKFLLYCNFSAPHHKIHFHKCVIIRSCGVEHYWRTAAPLITIRTQWKDGNFQGLWKNPLVSCCFVYSRLNFVLECSDIMLLTRYLNTFKHKINEVSNHSG